MKSNFGSVRRPLMALALVLAARWAHPAPAAVLPGFQLDGSVLLPNQWSLRPAGTQIPVGDFPVNVALHPGGVFAAVLHSGYSQHEVRILDLVHGQCVSQVMLDNTFYGLAWSPDGRALYASGGGDEVIHAFDFKNGYLSRHRELRLRPAAAEGVPTGLAVSAKGDALYIAESLGQRVEKMLTADGRVAWTRTLATAEAAAKTQPDASRRKVDNDPAAPFPWTCLPDEAHHRVFVSLWAKSAVLVLDSETGAELARWPVGDHPNEMVLASHGRLLVAEANRNTVSVVDTASGRVTETLGAALFPNSPPGSMPNSLALAPDETFLFVANANNNNVAIFELSTPGHAAARGFTPVGWFPTSVRVTRDGGTLVVANGKGIASLANPRGPYPGSRVPRELEEYIGSLMRGTVALIPLPKAAERAAKFGEWTKTAFACCPLDAAASSRGSACFRKTSRPTPMRWRVSSCCSTISTATAR